MSRIAWNTCRRPAADRGHYESWFLRANHPTRAQAFWIRYTLFTPEDDRPRLAELWFVFFDRDRGRVIARKSEHPQDEAHIGAEGLDFSLGTARLTDHALQGSIEDVAWNLEYEGDAAALLLLPRRLYDGGFPKAKSVVPLPLASFRGSLQVGDERIDVEGWIGSQNHNWGSRHTDRYAWGQVAGFDDEPDAFLECASAKLALGPLWTPWLSLVVLRLPSETIRINGLARSLLASARVRPGDWSFRTTAGDTTLRVHFRADAEDFVALRYLNPPGGSKVCLNSKTASCEVELERGGRTRVFRTRSRAAFELLMDPSETDRDPVV